VVIPSALVAHALAENGDHATYRYAGALGAFHWMSESQPTTNDCSKVQPSFVRSPFCGPGLARAQQENVKATDKGFKLTAKIPADRSQVSNAQLYLCTSKDICASQDGTTDMKTAVDNQQPLGPGTFVFQLDNFTSNRPGGAFPKEIVLGLYMYKPNMGIQGNVDTSNELDIEYHNWNGGDSTVSFTSWPQTITGAHLATTDTGVPSASAIPSCAAVRWIAGESATYGIWPAVDGVCDPKDCFGKDGCVTKEHSNSQIPTEHMIPAINLWWFGSLESIATDSTVSVTVSDFKYFPAGPSPTPPAPTPTPPAPTPPVRPTCCWSAWGDETQCGSYSGSGGLCNTDWTVACNSDSDCVSVLV